MEEGKHPASRRAPSLVLISLTVFVVLLPLTLAKPGVPPALKADEAAYYLAALSLWHDGDLVCNDTDARRLFREYPGTDNLKLTTRDRSRTVYFGVPFVYPLLASPFVGAFGSNGMVLLNAALLMAMVWMGVNYLRRYNSESLSILFASGFFLLSTAFVYVFWLQAEVFTMACVLAAFFLGERAAGGGSSAAREPRGRARGGWRPALAAAGSAALLATACYSKPMLAPLALPILFLLIKARSWRALASYLGAAILALGFLTGAAYALTNQVWPYFSPRMGVALWSPVDFVEGQLDARRPAGGAPQSGLAPLVPTDRIKDAAFEFRVTMVQILRDAIPEFLVGRHGGFLVYMPFAVLSIVFFLIHDRRSGFGWLILVSAALTAGLFVTLIRGHWLGGGDFVGNRYFVAAYPAFLFLATRLRPAWLTAVGYGAAAVFVGPLLITPLGSPALAPSLQAHVLNQPVRHLPLEWSLVRSRARPSRWGYQFVEQGGLGFHGRGTDIMPRTDELWIQGAKRVEVNLFSERELSSLTFDVRNLAPDNRIEICLQKDCRRLDFGRVPPEGASARITFTPGEPYPVPRTDRETHRYRMVVETEWGEPPRWRGSGKERFYLGAALTFLGSGEDQEREGGP